MFPNIDRAFPKLSRLVNGNNREANMGTIRVATMISELIEHGLWFFTYTNMICERIIFILVACGMEGSISFGYAIWWSLQKNAWMEHKTPP